MTADVCQACSMVRRTSPQGTPRIRPEAGKESSRRSEHLRAGEGVSRRGAILRATVSELVKTRRQRAAISTTRSRALKGKLNDELVQDPLWVRM